MNNTINEKEIAKASATALPISTKQSIEVCNYLRNKGLNKAKAILERVLEKKEAIPFKRFGSDTGHKRGRIAAGRYPQKTSKEILKVLNSVEANAQSKGLSTSDLKIIKLIANKASSPWHYGRQTRRKAKRTHIEIMVRSKEEEKLKQEGSKTFQGSASQNKEETPKQETSKKESKKEINVEKK